MSRLNQWFVPGDGIAREVIVADIQCYLGPDALVRPGPGVGNFEGRPGYWVTAYRSLTASMIQDLRLDSMRWLEECSQPSTDSRCGYHDSRTHAARQHLGPTETQVPPSTPRDAIPYTPSGTTCENYPGYRYRLESDSRSYPSSASPSNAYSPSPTTNQEPPGYYRARDDKSSSSSNYKLNLLLNGGIFGALASGLHGRQQPGQTSSLEGSRDTYIPHYRSPSPPTRTQSLSSRNIPTPVARLRKEDFKWDIVIADSKGNRINTVALLDTQCQTGNWISRRLVDQLQKTDQIDTSCETPNVADANSASVRSIGSITLQWKRAGGNRFFTCSFFVQSPSPAHYDVLMGVEYIASENLFHVNKDSLLPLLQHRKLDQRDKEAIAIAREIQRQEKLKRDARLAGNPQYPAPQQT